MCFCDTFLCAVGHFNLVILEPLYGLKNNEAKKKKQKQKKIYKLK